MAHCIKAPKLVDNTTMEDILRSKFLLILEKQGRKDSFVCFCLILEIVVRHIRAPQGMSEKE